MNAALRIETISQYTFFFKEVNTNNKNGESIEQFCLYEQ